MIVKSSFCEKPLCIVQATIYRCHAGGKIEIVQAYLDDDVRRLISYPPSHMQRSILIVLCSGKVGA